MFCKNCGNQIPDGVAFCAACGTPVAAAPAAAAPVYAAPAAPVAPAAPASDKSKLIKLIALGAAVVVFLVLILSLLGGGSPKSVAKKYVQAELDGDMKAGFSVMAGKMQKCYEKEIMSEYKDEMFEMMEEQCEEMDIKANIKNFNQYYKASKKVTKAEMTEEFGKGYKVKIKIREVDDLRSSEIEAIQEMYDSEMYEDYIDANKIKKGKKVTVAVIIEGKESDDTEEIEVYVVKYKGKWKVVNG